MVGDSQEWAQSRDITLTIESPSAVQVAVSGPGGLSATLDSGTTTYTAEADKYDEHIEDVLAILDYFDFK